MPDVKTKTHSVVGVKGIGRVFVPAGTNLADLHQAILKHEAYQQPNPPDLSYPTSGDPSLPETIDSTPQITAAGAIENSAQFRKATAHAWKESADKRGVEAGFSVEKDGQITDPVTYSSDESDGHDHLYQQDTPDTMALLHTHNKYAAPMPSQADVAEAEKIKKPIIVANRIGLYEIDGTGKIHQVFKNDDWLDRKPMIYESLIEARIIAKQSGQPVLAKDGKRTVKVSPDGSTSPSDAKFSK